MLDKKIYVDENSSKAELMDRIRMLENIIELMPMNVYWMNRDGFYLGCNQNEAELIGLESPSDLIGKRNKDIPGFLIPEVLDPINEQVMSSKKPIELEEPAVLQNGKKAIFLSSKAPLYDSEKKEVIGMLGISIDITERKAMEQKLAETTQTLEKVLDTIPGHVYWKDLDGVYVGCNELQAKDLRLSKDQVIGKTDYELASKEIADELRATDLEIMRTGESKTLEEWGAVLDENRVFLSRKVPFYDTHDKDKIVGVLGVSLDITDQKKTEAELNETLHKLEGMTLVSASIAHELRTPLQSLAFGVESLDRFLPSLIDTYKIAEEKEIVENKIRSSSLDLLGDILATMRKEINMSSLTIDLLLMNLRTEVESKQDITESFSIADCVKEAIERYPFQKKQIGLVEVKMDSTFEVKGKSTLFTHVLFNLIKNALYHLAKAGKGNISIYLEKGKDFNTLMFKDTGTGIPEKNLPHIFDRFVTKTNHGAGVGLAFCKMVMESMKGEISCESVEGKYALFKMNFPKEKEGAA